MLVSLCKTKGQVPGAIFVRSLTCLIELSQVGVRPSLLPHHISFAQSHAEDVAACYRAALRLVTAMPPTAPVASVRWFEQHGVVPLLLKFVLQPANPVHVFELPHLASPRHDVNKK